VKTEVESLILEDLRNNREDSDYILEQYMPQLGVETVLAVLNDQNESVILRANIARGLLFMPKDIFNSAQYRIVQALRNMLTDDNPGLQIHAMDVLEALRINDAAVHNVVEELTHDENPMVRQNAEHRLTGMLSKRGIEALRESKKQLGEYLSKKNNESFKTLEEAIKTYKPPNEALKRAFKRRK
jgi:HEAT repeat protein